MPTLQYFYTLAYVAPDPLAAGIKLKESQAGMYFALGFLASVTQKSTLSETLLSFFLFSSTSAAASNEGERERKKKEKERGRTATR